MCPPIPVKCIVVGPEFVYRPRTATWEFTGTLILPLAERSNGSIFTTCSGVPSKG